MVFHMCLEALLSGLISYQTTTFTYNKNNGIFYDLCTTHQCFVIPDKYNTVQLCDENKGERFVYIKNLNKLQMVSEIDDE